MPERSSRLPSSARVPGVAPHDIKRLSISVSSPANDVSKNKNHCSANLIGNSLDRKTSMEDSQQISTLLLFCQELTTVTHCCLVLLMM